MLALALLCAAVPARARVQKASGPPAAPQQEPKPPAQPAETHAHHGMEAGTGGTMSAATALGGPFRSMTAMGSGTGLLPASTQSRMIHLSRAGWSLALHGELKVGYDHQARPRGVDKAESQNWAMGMAEHGAGPGRLMLRVMLSAEPWTTPNRGFPQLFQTGESYQGRAIVDAQHPHDLLMEVAAAYHLPVSEQAAIHLYAGPVGEPALGPAAFMHRTSASENPAAPLGHHLQDSSHITHGVVTAGATVWRIRAEGSIFHGAEPDENRKDLELGKLDSWSARLSVAPGRNWAIQYSHGHIVDPELLDPGSLVRRTASVAYNRAWHGGQWSSTAVWGRNRELHGVSSSYLAESTVRFKERYYAYTRLELVDKFRLFERNVWNRLPLFSFAPVPAVAGLGLRALGAAELGLRAPGFGDRFHHKFSGPPSRIGAVTLGGVRDVIASPRLRVGVGGDFTFYRIPAALEPTYGARPIAVHLFVRVRPGMMHH
jgi:hypothetical protein